MVGPLISYPPYKLSSKIRNLHKNNMIALYVLYLSRTARKPLKTTKCMRDSHEHERALKRERTNYYIEYLKINFPRCLHAETSSLHLFNVASSGFVMMKCFSAVHCWHLPVRFVYGFAFSRMFQPIVYLSFLLFSSQTYLLSSVLFLHFSLLKDV